MLEDLPRHPFRQIDQAVVILDVDATDEPTLDPRLVGDGAHDLAGGHAVATPYLDAVTHQPAVTITVATLETALLAMAILGAPGGASLETGLTPLLVALGALRLIGTAKALAGSALTLPPRGSWGTVEARGAWGALGPEGATPPALALGEVRPLAKIVARGVALILLGLRPLGTFVMFLLVEALTPVLGLEKIQTLDPLPAFLTLLGGLARRPLRARRARRSGGAAPLLTLLVAPATLEALSLLLAPLEPGLGRRLGLRGRLQGPLALSQEAQGRGDVHGLQFPLAGDPGDQAVEKVQVLLRQGLGDHGGEALDAMSAEIRRGRRGQLGDAAADGALDGLEQVALPRLDEQQGAPLAPGAAGTADAVHVGGRVHGDVEVDHQAEALEVQAPGGHVGGDQDVEAAVLETLHRALALTLGHVPVEGLGIEAVGGELFRHLQGLQLGADEDQHGVEGLHLQHPGQHVPLVEAGHQAVVLVDGLHRLRRRHQTHLHRLAQMGVGDLADRLRHGGGEEGHLPLRGSLGEDPVDVLGEAHVEHLIGLVQDKGAQALEVQGAAAQMIHDPPRGADDHLHAPLQLPRLEAEAGTTVKGQDVEAAQAAGIGLEGLRHLKCQLTGGGQHQNLGLGPQTQIDPADQGQGEGRGLAGAGLRLAEQVPPGQQMGDALALNGRRHLVAQGLDGIEDDRGQPELIEALALQEGVQVGAGLRCGGQVSADFRRGGRFWRGWVFHGRGRFHGDDLGDLRLGYRDSRANSGRSPGGRAVAMEQSGWTGQNSTIPWRRHGKIAFWRGGTHASLENRNASH